MTKEDVAVTTPPAAAYQAILAHHRVLEENVARRVAALTEAVASGGRHEVALADLISYVASEVLPHAMAEEHSIYAVAAARPELAGTVGAMVEEHRSLASMAEELAKSTGGARAAELARTIGEVFAAHVTKENERLLPPLAADEGTDLAQLVVQMHRLTEAAQRETPAHDDLGAPDPEEGTLALLLEATAALSSAGETDHACRLVASAWSVLRMPRPELAVRTTAALHRLVRQIASAPVAMTPRRDAPATGEVLDVRLLAPAQRHERIFDTYRTLAPGEAFTLVNDHDPKPLHYQFEAEHAGGFTWDALEAGPEVWRVAIGKPADAPASAADSGVEVPLPELDVRRLVHGRRHEIIFATYEGLAPGEGFVLVNDHDPQPLRYQFDAVHPGRYTWDYLERGPAAWRVRIGRMAVVATQ